MKTIITFCVISLLGVNIDVCASTSMKREWSPSRENANANKLSVIESDDLQKSSIELGSDGNVIDLYKIVASLREKFDELQRKDKNRKYKLSDSFVVRVRVNAIFNAFKCQEPRLSISGDLETDKDRIMKFFSQYHVISAHLKGQNDFIEYLDKSAQFAAEEILRLYESNEELKKEIKVVVNQCREDIVKYKKI